MTLRLLDGRITMRGGGYGPPVAVLPAQDGLSVLVVEAEGRILSASREDTNRSSAVVLAEFDLQAVAARRHPDDDTLLVLEAGDDARLLRVNLALETIEPVAEGLAHPVAFVVEPTTRQAVILERPATGPRLVAIDIDSGAQVVIGAAADATALVAAPPGAGAGVIVASGGTGSTSLRSLAGLPDVAGPVIGLETRALAMWGSLLLAVTTTGVEAIEWGLPDGVLPITVPLGPAFVRGWLVAEINPLAAGIAPADVELVVDEGVLAASISAGIEAPAPSGARRVRLVTGPVPGEYHLTARRKSDGARLGQARFRVTRHWPDREIGPPVAITGKAQHFMMWGGGPNGPQNLGNHKAPDDWRVAVVLVSTTNKRLPADLTAMKQLWEDRLLHAAVSARNYYQEVSFRNTAAGPGSPAGTTISMTTPIFTLDLENGWGDYFEQPQDKGNWRGWDPQQTAKSAIAGAFCDMLDRTGQGNVLEKIDAVLFVVQTATEHLSIVGTKLALPMYVWPQASRTDFYRKTQLPGGPTTWTFGQKPIIFMPSHTPSKMPAAQKMQSVNHTHILCHELGHTLGCGDLYDRGDFTAEVAARTVGALDLMDNDATLPHFSLPNRMRLGWIGANWIERFDFSVNATPKTVTLQAAETLARTGPPPGRVAGIEVRVRDGWNYYFEYRRLQPGQIGDQSLTSISAAAQ
ncbi:MAG: hypothetical protein M3439_11790, partial [Chloroflexota bacterium]|nr:hypothetical protein [Chloroflexota bacterium]